MIQIHQYEIVAQHHGPKRTKITMLINNLIHVGSDGSPPFGSPSSIECQPPIIELLEKLQTLRAQEQPASQSLTSFKAARDHIASPSQATSISSADDGSQAIFATQIPRLQSKKRLREGSLKSNEYQSSAPDESDSARSADVVNGRDGSDRALDAESPSRHGAQELSRSHDRQVPSNPMDMQKEVNGQTDGEKRVPEQEEAQTLTKNQAEDTVTKRQNLILELLARNNAKPENVKQQPLKTSEQAKQQQQDPQDPVTPPSTVSKNPSPDRQTIAAIPVQKSRVKKPSQRSSVTPPDPNKPARQLSKVGLTTFIIACYFS